MKNLSFKRQLDLLLATSERGESTQLLHWPARRLAIEVLIMQPPGKSVLRLWRTNRISRDALPTPADWRTVIAALPFAVNCTPQEYHVLSRSMLIGSWLTPRRLLDILPPSIEPVGASLVPAHHFNRDDP